jgi:hypothetical protein
LLAGVSAMTLLIAATGPDPDPRSAAPGREPRAPHAHCGAKLGPSGSGFAGRASADSILGPGEIVYLGTYPSNCRPGWTIDLQGVTHDSGAWFFTQKAALWRFPASRDLGATVLLRGPGALHVRMPPALARDGYNHFGALAYHAGLLLIPVTGPAPAVVAVFRARDLVYLGHLQLPAQRGAGWLAVGPRAEMYSSDSELDGARGLLVYTVDWSLLGSGRLPLSPGRTDPRQRALIQMIPRTTIPLLDETGQPVQLRSMQGGVFHGATQILTVNGYCEGTTRETGIMGFAIRGDTGRRVVRSTNRPGPFEFEYHPGHRGLFWCREEPEGMTIWDLDDGRAPGIRGELHVLMIDNALWDYGGLYFRHYRLGRGGSGPLR